MKGCYVICDGGYHRWRQTMSPFKNGLASDVAGWRWNKWLESNRKDVECTFGILKARFRILKVRRPPLPPAACRSSAPASALAGVRPRSPACLRPPPCSPVWGARLE